MFLSFIMAGVLAAAPSAMLDQYCVGCHSQRAKDRGAVPISLENVDMNQPAANAELWERVIRKVRAGVMPPPGSRRPDAATLHEFITSIESRLDQAAEATPNPGRPLVHRLNRAEYANAIRDLLSLDVDAASLL